VHNAKREVRHSGSYFPSAQQPAYENLN
jgi:hypothetical protein